MSLQPITLTGNYVRLEPLEEKHIPALAAVGCEDSIWKNMAYGLIRNEEDMKVWVKDLLNRQAQGTDLPFVVIHLEADQVAGATRYLEYRPEHRGLEIGGTWYGIEYQRTAVNTECKYLLLKCAFEELGCIRVQFKTDLRNERSQQAIKRIGGVKEGILRNHMIRADGSYRDSIYYSIIERDWPVVKIRLETMLG